MSVPVSTTFHIDDHRFAALPAERRGVARDGVRLLVAGPGALRHTTFARLGEALSPGDLLVVNDSATVAGQYDAVADRHGRVVAHIGTSVPGGGVMVELRSAPDASAPILDARVGDRLTIAREVAHDAATLTLRGPYPRAGSPNGRGNRVWRADLHGDLPVERARPIAYGYLAERLGLQDYQTVFSRTPGSAEMPSAARPFTRRVLQDLTQRGVAVATITLHTGFSSQDVGEPPLPEWRAVPQATADAVNATRLRGRRVVAVGTTAARALESAVVDGPVGAAVAAADGWTGHLIGPESPSRVLDGIVTGWHNPDASHLALVESVAGADVTQRAYDAAAADGYLWHEFGDAGLLLRGA